MKYKILFFSVFIIAILTIGAVSADDVQANETSTDDSKIDLNITYDYGNENVAIEYPEEISESKWWGNDIVSVSNMPRDASGNISMNIDDIERYNKRVSAGGNAYSLGDLNLGYGNHSLIIKYDGDSKYNGFIKNASFEKTYILVECPNEFSLDGGDFSLDVQLNKGVTGNIKILIDKKVVYNKKYDANDYPSISLNRYVGYHTYEVRYSGGNQKDLIKKGSFNASIFEDPFFDVYYSDNLHYGDDVTFELSMPDGSYGFARFKGNKYSFESDEDAHYTYVTISGFEAGENEVDFTVYYDDGSQTRTCSVFVSPKVTVPKVLLVNESYSLIFNSSKDFTGDLILSGMINGTFKVENGSVVIPISCSDIGNYTLNVSCGSYNESYNISVLDEIPEVNINYSCSEVIYPWYMDYDLDPDHEEFIYVISLDAGPYAVEGGSVATYLDGNLVGVINEGFDRYHLWPDYYAFGNHSVKVVYSGDNTFKATNKTFNYTVEPYYCGIEMGVVQVYVPDEIYGTVTVKANGKTYTKKIEKYTGPYNEGIALQGLKSGVNYTIDVSFKANMNKYSFTKSLSYMQTCPIEIYWDDDYIYGRNNTISVTVPKGIKNKLDIKIDGKSYKYIKNYDYWDSDLKMACQIDISDAGIGSHEVVVSYPGDDKYPSNSTNRSFEVISQIETSFDSSPTFIYLNLPGDAKGNLTVEYKNNEGDDYKLLESVALSDGKASIQLPFGKRYYRAYYTGSDYQIEESCGLEYVRPNVAYPSSMKYAQDKEFKILDKINATLVFCIGDSGFSLPVCEFDLSQNNTIFIRNIVNEALKHNMAKLTLNYNYNEYGSYFLDLYPYVYSDVGDFDLSLIEVKFAAKLTDAKDITMQYSEGKTFSFKVYDIFGKLVGKNQAVKIKIGKKTFTAKTDKNGVVKFKIPNTITPGKYTITATYKNAKISKKLTVKQILSIKTVKVKKSAKKLVLTATLKKVKGKYLKGKTITFKFNGKTYKAKTNKKGVAKYTIKKSVLKKLKVGKKVTYQATYLKTTVKKTAKVKR